MKIKGVQVRVVRAGAAKPKTKVITPVIPGAKRVSMGDKRIRDAYSSALRRAASTGAKSIAIGVRAHQIKDFPPVALAKIVAQEIFRYIQEKKSKIRKIDVFLNRGNNYKLFNKTVDNYLRHIVRKLSCGPFVTVDAIIEIKGGVVLIKRSNPPFGWAIPGGFLDYGESLERAAAREAEEETGLKVKNLKQFHTYSGPGRDPRFHTVTTVFICSAKGVPKGASDAAEAGIFTPKEWERLKLAFDHRKVLKDYLRYKRSLRNF